MDDLAALSDLDLAKMIGGAIATSAPAWDDFVAIGRLSSCESGKRSTGCGRGAKKPMKGLSLSSAHEAMTRFHGGYKATRWRKSGRDAVEVTMPGRIRHSAPTPRKRWS